MTDAVKWALASIDDDRAYYWAPDDLVYEARVLAAEVRRLQAENKRLVARVASCPNCGGDYAVTGLEVECPCRLQAENAKLRDLLRRGITLCPHAQQWCDEVEAVLGDAPGEKGGA